MTNTGTYQKYPALEALPTLVRRQRRLEKIVAQVTKDDMEQEKACRKAIDALLIEAGLAHGDSVTCNGYDVTHNDQKGRDALNTEKLTAHLVNAGVSLELVTDALIAATDTGERVKFASVKPSKGAAVRK